jgi:hypothetical protein
MMDFMYDSDLSTMTESALIAEAGSVIGAGIGEEIGNVINGLDEQRRIAILKLLIQIMRMGS